MELTRAMTPQRSLRAESKNCEILLCPTADRRFDRKVTCPTMWASFGQIPHYMEFNASQMPGDCPGAGDWAVLELTGTFLGKNNKKLSF